MVFVPSLLSVFLEEPDVPPLPQPAAASSAAASRSTSIISVVCSSCCRPSSTTSTARPKPPWTSRTGAARATRHSRRFRSAGRSPTPGIYILDERPAAAAGRVGRHAATSAGGLARGYHARPGLTADRFVPHPLRASRRASLRHRRSRALPARRQRRVPRPPRSPGEAARLPHRARRNRVPAQELDRRSRTRW